MNAQLETPVALIFFTRPDTFKKVFDEVRKAKPKKLFLIQDGPRDNKPDDVEKIMECRKIAEDIDWECEVHKNYSDVNLGCGVRPASGISWVFEHVDRTIILEDDCIPCETFFSYCEEMLNKYENDERISYVSGLNHFEEWDCGQYSYFFTQIGAIWGWATWKRVWDKYDYYVDLINNEYVAKLLQYSLPNSYVAQTRIKNYRKINITKNTKEKLSFWDTQFGAIKNTQNQLVIVPKYNQITNIGIGASSSHAQSLKETKFIKYKNFVFMPSKKLEFPLVHQEYCMRDVEYDNLVYRIMYGNRYMKYLKKIVKKIIRRG